MTPYEVVAKLPIDQEPLPEQDVASLQSRMDWLQSSETQRVFKEVTNESNQLIADAIGLSLVNHQSDNSKQIVHKLIEANCLRKLVGKYARNK